MLRLSWAVTTCLSNIQLGSASVLCLIFESGGDIWRLGALALVDRGPGSDSGSEDPIVTGGI